MNVDLLMNLDIFTGKFRPSIRRSVWGHGESGYELIIFSSHEEAEVKKALRAFLTNIKEPKDEQT